jgi:ABC-type dipeptide/oligopeptide/nickel transport system ATPase component
VTPLLEIDKLSLEFRTRSGIVRALENVSLQIPEGGSLGLVGESGSGKSVLSFAMLGIQDAAARVTAGSIHFAGKDLLANGGAAMKTLRGRELAMIFQNPRVALRSGSRSRTCCADTPSCAARRRAPVPSSAWPTCAFPIPSAATPPTPSSCPAACASA